MTIWPNVLKIGYILYSVSSPALLSLLLLTMTASRTHDLPAIRHLYIPHANFCFVFKLFRCFLCYALLQGRLVLVPQASITVTVYSGVTRPAHSMCVLSGYSSATKLIVGHSFNVRALMCT